MTVLVTMIMMMIMMMVVNASDNGAGRDDDDGGRYDVEAGYREIMDRRNRPRGGRPVEVDR